MGEFSDLELDRLFDSEYEGDADGITCKFCGAEFLTWEEARGEHNRKRWVLLNVNGSIHECRSVAAANEFPLEDQ